MKKIILIIISLLCFIPIANAEEIYEAQIGELKYKTIEEAINVANNEQEIKLLSNVETISVSNDKNVIINLNNNSVGTIKNSGTLLLRGPGIVHYNLSLFFNNNGIINYENANLTIDNIQFTTDSHGWIIVNSGTIIMKNSSIMNNDNNQYQEFLKNEATGKVTIESGIYNSHDLFNNEGTLTINGGTFTISSNTVANYNETGNLVINGGSFNAPNNCFIMNIRGNLTINGGNFSGECVAQNYDPDYYKNSQKIESIINVNNGTFNTTGIAFGNTSLSRYSKIYINNGKIASTSTDYPVIVDYGSDNTISILGGNIKGTSISAGLLSSNSKMIFGSNDGVVTKDSPIIELTPGRLTGPAKYEFYDGKFIIPTNELGGKAVEILIPTGYHIKYDDNGNSTYTAYLSKIEEIKPEPPSEDENQEIVTPEDDKKQEITTPEVEDNTQKGDVEETVENPPTSLYISLGFLGIAILGFISLVFVKTKNYFSKI